MFLAYDEDLDKRVVLKKPKDFTPETHAQIKEETRNARGLRHRNIVQVYGIQPNRSTPENVFIVMEYIDGTSLSDTVRQGHRFSVREAVNIVCHVADGLEHAHGERVVHCDIKPGNILIAQDGAGTPIVKIIDFGLSLSQSLTSHSVLRGGTLPYKAPEQLSEHCDRRADVHALAVLTFQLLTGQLPFGENRTADTVPRVAAGFTDEVNRILTTACSWEADDRPDTPIGFVESLVAALRNDPAGLQETTVPISPNHAGTGGMPLGNLVGRCYFCGRDHGPYDPTKNRFCCTGDLPPHVAAKFEEHHSIFPTVFPVPAEEDPAFAPPHPASRPCADIFAISAADSQQQACDTLPVLPFPNDCVLTEHLRCGNATLHNLEHISTRFGFAPQKITVLDMATYSWSNTLKDPRSWAVINTALKYGIHNLGVWTAGNAGTSLARMAYAVNCLLPQKDRITVYCYSAKDDLSPRITAHLRGLQARVATFGRPRRGKVFSPEQARNFLKATLRISLDLHDYWDVSDGWDGVGLYVYRLLGRQICYHLRPKYIVCPIGTGNLFFGLYLGRKDCIDQGVLTPTSCQLVGAVPFGDSIVENYHELGLGADLPVLRAEKTTRPEAPKLATIYTPLLLVMYPSIVLDTSVRLIEVGRKEQDSATEILFSPSGRGEVVAEPSAVVAFGALSALSGQILEKSTKSDLSVDLAEEDVVVINTGCGVVE